MKEQKHQPTTQELNLLKRRLRVELGELPPQIREINLYEVTFLIREPVLADYLAPTAFVFPLDVLNLLIYIRAVDGKPINEQDQLQLYELGKTLCEVPSQILQSLYTTCVLYFPHVNYEWITELPNSFFAEYAFTGPIKTPSQIVNAKITMFRTQLLDELIQTVEKILGTLFEPSDFTAGGIRSDKLRVPLSFAIRPEMQEFVRNRVRWLSQQVQHQGMPDQLLEEMVELEGGIKVPRSAIKTVEKEIAGTRKESTVIELYHFPRRVFKQVMLGGKLVKRLETMSTKMDRAEGIKPIKPEKKAVLPTLDRKTKV